jgi:hypothetical protein
MRRLSKNAETSSGGGLFGALANEDRSLPPTPMSTTDLESRASTSSEPTTAIISDRVALKYCTCFRNGMVLPAFYTCMVLSSSDRSQV